MSAAAVLTRLKAAGVSITVADGQLKVKGPKTVLSDDVLNELRAHKPALLQLLAKATPLDLDGVAIRIGGWLHAMDQLPKACGIDAQKLKAITIDFAIGCWAQEAVRLEWSDADLFAIDGGLIPEMSRRALHFRAVGEDAIGLINGRGAYEVWQRRDMANALPWWRDGRCVGGRDAVH
jgi:TubC N-terminal docking domain